MNLESFRSQKIMDQVIDARTSTCATIALETILPHKPKPEHVEAAGYCTHIDTLSFLIYREMATHNIIPIIKVKDPMTPPSKFFRDIYRSINHGSERITHFYGGLLVPTDHIKSGLDEFDFGHVITIKGLHTHNKATIIDTNNYRPYRKELLPYERKVSLSSLDRRIDNTEQPNCIAILGLTTFVKYMSWLEPEDARNFSRKLNARFLKDNITLANIINEAENTKSSMENAFEASINPLNLTKRTLRYQRKLVYTKDF